VCKYTNIGYEEYCKMRNNNRRKVKINKHGKIRIHRIPKDRITPKTASTA